jgi:hypothetical protein
VDTVAHGAQGCFPSWYPRFICCPTESVDEGQSAGEASEASRDASASTGTWPATQLSVCLLPTNRQNRKSDRQERPALNHVVAKSSHARGEPDDGD